MATKEQHDFFKDQYVDEEKRSTDLNKRVEIYFSILSVFLTSIIFKLKDIYELYEKSQSRNKVISFGAFIIAFILFGFAFYYIVRALQIRVYQAVIDFENYRKKLKEIEPTNGEFFDDRIIDYMYATEHNEKVNDGKANNLEVALKFILAGFLAIALFIIILLIQNLPSWTTKKTNSQANQTNMTNQRPKKNSQIEQNKKDTGRK
jgi:hypothetical protein